MIASLPMYDLPAVRPIWQALWDATVEISEADLPKQLIWDAPEGIHWQDPDLALSQTCSLPYRMDLADHVTLLGAFDFDLPGCPPGYYSSVLVMRADDPRTTPNHWPALRLAFNSPKSQSGWAAAYDHMAQNLPQTGLETGSHAASARAVSENRADIAALDAQTYVLLDRHTDQLAGLREIARTAPTPGLPLITAKGRNAATLFAALQAAVRSLAPVDRTALGLKDLIALPGSLYRALPIPPHPGEVLTLLPCHGAEDKP